MLRIVLFSLFHMQANAFLHVQAICLLVTPVVYKLACHAMQAAARALRHQKMLAPAVSMDIS